MKSFCVYLTIYRGNKLPQFYIGYTKTNKITDENYHGTVSSKRYKQIYKRETKEHPELFKTIILSLFETEIEAKNREYYIQKYFKLPKNPLFINLSYSDGTFGGSGENHPMYGRKHTEESKRKNSLSHKGRKHTEDAKLLMSKKHKGRKGGFSNKTHSEQTKTILSNKFKGINNPNFGKTHTEKSKEKISKTSKGKVACRDPSGNSHKITVEELKHSNGFWVTCKSNEGQRRKLLS